MEAAAAAAAMVELSALSRRELVALCKLNGVRANMTNLAMVETLQSLPSVSIASSPPSEFTRFHSVARFADSGFPMMIFSVSGALFDAGF